MLKILPYTLTGFLLFAAQASHANIEIDFLESAPKDRFTITNTGKCLLQNVTLEIDLSKSAGGLIFDTTATGAGVEVFQPFEVTRGDIKLASKATVQDGDSTLILSIPSFPSNDSVSFTIDVDDTMTSSKLGKIRVAGSEIVNGVVKVSASKYPTSTALFGNDSKATIVQPTCLA